jgi:hypothetical protein
MDTQVIHQKPKKKETQQPLILKGWTFNKDGKSIKELIEISFLEFYFTKKTAMESHGNL